MPTLSLRRREPRHRLPGRLGRATRRRNGRCRARLGLPAAQIADPLVILVVGRAARWLPALVADLGSLGRRR